MGYGPRGHRQSDTAAATSHIRGGKQRLRARAILVLSSSNFPRLSFWGHNTDFCLFVFVYVVFFFLSEMASMHSESVSKWKGYYFHQ